MDWMDASKSMVKFDYGSLGRGVFQEINGGGLGAKISSYLKGITETMGMSLISQ